MYNNTFTPDTIGYGRIINPTLEDFNSKRMPTDVMPTMSFTDTISTAEDLCNFLSSLIYYDRDTNKPIDNPVEIERHLEGKYYCKITPEMMTEIIKSIKKISRGY